MLGYVSLEWGWKETAEDDSSPSCLDFIFHGLRKLLVQVHDDLKGLLLS